MYWCFHPFCFVLFYSFLLPFFVSYLFTYFLFAFFVSHGCFLLPLMCSQLWDSIVMVTWTWVENILPCFFSYIWNFVVVYSIWYVNQVQNTVLYACTRILTHDHRVFFYVICSVLIFSSFCYGTYYSLGLSWISYVKFGSWYFFHPFLTLSHNVNAHSNTVFTLYQSTVFLALLHPMAPAISLIGVEVERKGSLIHHVIPPTTPVKPTAHTSLCQHPMSRSRLCLTISRCEQTMQIAQVVHMGEYLNWTSVD